MHLPRHRHEREISRAQLEDIWLRVANADLSALPDMAYWHDRYPSLVREYNEFVAIRERRRAKGRPVQKAPKDEYNPPAQSVLARVGAKPVSTITISAALAGSGVTVNALHKLWSQRRKGGLTPKLEQLLIQHPRLQVVLDSFERGKALGAGSGNKKPKKPKPQPETTWTRLAAAKTSQRPLQGGLPSLGKRN